MEINEATQILNALSSEPRLAIYKILVKHSKTGITPTEISELLDNMPRNTLSFHLSALSNAGLCETQKNGKQVIYTANCNAIKQVAEFLLKDCYLGGCTC